MPADEPVFGPITGAAAARHGGIASARMAYTCPHCGRVTLDAGPAARHRNACDRRPLPERTGFTSVELFAGAGGLALGLTQAGFQHLAVIERDAEACTTLRHNKVRVPEMVDWSIVEADARDVDYGVWSGGVTLLSAGAPCQPFSRGGKQRGDADERNMFPEVLRAVRELRPDAVVIENVKGLLSESSKTYFSYILDQLRSPDLSPRPGEAWTDHHGRVRTRAGKDHNAPSELRYTVDWEVLNAADFGLPQHRERVFIVAFREDLGVQWERVTPTQSRDALLFAQWVDGSYWREHGIAPLGSAPPRTTRRIAQLALFDVQPGERWRTVRDALRDLPEPVNGVESPLFVNHAGIPGARSYHGHTGSPLDYPAKTLKAGAHGVPGGENMLLKADGSVRYFTIREMARLQGFPDKFEVRGAWTRAMRQLGNAVPVVLARVVGDRIRELLNRAHEVAQVA